MDTVSHAAWGATFIRQQPYVWWAVLFGILPDAIPTLYILIRQGGRINGNILALIDDYPRHDPHLKVYYWAHSILPITVVAALIAVINPFYVILTVPYYLHLLMDIFTHRGVWATRIFYPFSTFHFHGKNWWNQHWITLGNWTVLVIINIIFFLR